jgi:type II secretory pathway pseudopilin PulG
MARRALTLLELLLALSLLLAIWALVLPLAADSLRDRTFDAGAEMLHDQLLLARAHAGATGRPVEIGYEPSTSTIDAAYFRPDAGAETDGERGLSPKGTVPLRSSDEGDDEIPAQWAATRLPDGLSISGFEEDEAPPSAMRLAVFMPDGSALFSRPVWLGDGHGRKVKFSLNPWTGLAAREPVP